MKYGESSFDIAYLLFAVISGCLILRRADSKTERYMGIAAVVLGCGDAFHLIPRVLNYFLNRDMSVYLGVGKLVTSITMTVFYLLLYRIWIGLYEEKKNMNLSVVIYCTVILRIALCFFPQNGWFENSSDMTWGILRNIPFVILGALICYMYFKNRKKEKGFGLLWICILLSFAFYIPVAVGAGLIPMLGMLMLPKTICYILMIAVFLKNGHREVQERS